MEQMTQVLIIEDNKIVCCAYEYLMESFSLQYKIVMTAKDALLFLKKNKVKIILCDIYLPDMNGFDLCKKMRKLEHIGEDFPIVAVSSNMLTSEADGIYPFSDFIEKPLEASDFKRLLKKYTDILSVKK